MDSSTSTSETSGKVYLQVSDFILFFSMEYKHAGSGKSKFKEKITSRVNQTKTKMFQRNTSRGRALSSNQ